MSATEISIIICSVAFVVLVIYLVRTLISLRSTLESLNRQLNATTEISYDVQGKLKNLDSLFNAFSLFGATIEEKAAKCQICQSKGKEKTAELVEWVVLGLDLWQKMRRKNG